MWPFYWMKVRLKLALLAGVPVLGALLLSVLIARDARQRVETTAAIGTIDDLAQLTDQMARLAYQLRVERARTAYSVGIGEANNPIVQRETRETDAALDALEQFLRRRDESKLPPQLGRHLKIARESLAELAAVRAKTRGSDFRIDEYLEFYNRNNDSLISATASLVQLTVDGELLRRISGLVATMQVIERVSREHALLSYVFGRGEFPPGAFRTFVTLMTEQEVYSAALQTTVTDAELLRVQAALRGKAAEKVAAMRKVALENTDERLSVDAAEWFSTQESNLQSLRSVEQEAADGVRQIAERKLQETRSAVWLGAGLAGAVLFVSSVLAGAIARGIIRSVHVLTSAAESVQRHGDFGIRAAKTSSDELGLLTDAFNGMLAGIQDRDRELQAHRETLEAQVESRTRQLSERTDQMRLVLDNVEEGLAMIDRRGKLLPEYSRVFGLCFDHPTPGTSFASVLSPHDASASMGLRLAYEQLIDDVLPLELAIAQMPSAILRGERRFALRFQPVLHGGKVDKTLLSARDVTAELAARRAEVLQRERIKAFEHVMRDRFGFMEFLREARALVDRIRADIFADPFDRLRTVHTLKGTSAIFDLQSVAEAAHQLEEALAEGDGEIIQTVRAGLVATWDDFAQHVIPVVGDDGSSSITLTRQELEALISSVRARRDHCAIERALVRLRHEPMRLRFQRIEEQLKAVAVRVGKPAPHVIIDAEDVRIPVTPFRGFWSSFAHIVRNVADHGLQQEGERLAAGKPRENRVELRARSREEALTIEIADDGRGIDWCKLAEKARQNGLPYETRADLVQAMLSDGISTAARVSETSGRGVGMAAVLQACTALNGQIEVESEIGKGTQIRFIFPSIETFRVDSILSPAASRSVV